MPNYIIVRILEHNSFISSRTEVYGSVEIRPASSDLHDESLYLKESAEKNSLDYNKYAYIPRISTIIYDMNKEEALEKADNAFSTILDLKKYKYAYFEYAIF
ncbi:MAG: hypothetical protein KBC57_13775 [Neisseriaceae bacterium]|nr:hypothetical protein [Neisseriaceae bacterium]